MREYVVYNDNGWTYIVEAETELDEKSDIKTMNTFIKEMFKYNPILKKYRRLHIRVDMPGEESERYTTFTLLKPDDDDADGLYDVYQYIGLADITEAD